MVKLLSRWAHLIVVALGLLALGLLAGCGETATATAVPPTVAPTFPAERHGRHRHTRPGRRHAQGVGDRIPPAIKLAAGHQTFNVTNAGKLTHNFTIVVGDKTFATPNLHAGETATLETDLPAGTYNTLCSIPGHKEQGMAGTLTIK